MNCKSARISVARWSGWPRGRGGYQENKRESNQETVQADGGLGLNFKGELSLGVDTITNSVLVSARGKPLLQLVCDMIAELDAAAAPQGNVEVYQLGPGMVKGTMADALRKMLDKQSRQSNGRTDRGRSNAKPSTRNGDQADNSQNSRNNQGDE